VKVARALREGLEREKYKLSVAPTGEEGFFLVNAEEFDLVLWISCYGPRRAPGAVHITKNGDCKLPFSSLPLAMLLRTG